MTAGGGAEKLFSLFGNTVVTCALDGVPNLCLSVTTM
jgi:hypothetical protein